MNKHLLITAFILCQTAFSQKALAQEVDFSNFENEFSQFETREPIYCLKSHENINEKAHQLIQSSYPETFKTVHTLQSTVSGANLEDEENTLQESYVGYEGFVRLDPGTKTIVKEIGFNIETTTENVVYICLSIDTQDPQKSVIQLVFLEGQGLDGPSFVNKIPILKEFYPEPKLIIKPVTMWLSPVTAAYNNLFGEVLSKIPGLKQLNNFLVKSYRAIRNTVITTLAPLIGNGIEEVLITDTRIEVKIQGHISIFKLPHIDYKPKVDNILTFDPK